MTHHLASVSFFVFIDLKLNTSVQRPITYLLPIPTQYHTNRRILYSREDFFLHLN